MAAAEERLLSEGDGGALCAARLSPTPLPPPPEAPALLEQPPQSNTLMGLPIVAIESILSFLSYDETSQLRLVGAGPGRGGGPVAAGPRARGCGWRGRDGAGGFLVSAALWRGVWWWRGQRLASRLGGLFLPGGCRGAPPPPRGRLLLAAVLADLREGAGCAGRHRHIKK